MKTAFSTKWKASKQPRKQRKYAYNAPLHIKHKLLGSPLSKELRQKYKKRSMPLRSGDKVKIMTGKFKGETGTIDRINIEKTEIYITGIEINKRDGSKVNPPLHPSNVMITDLKLDDKRRMKTVKQESKDTKDVPEKGVKNG